MEIMHLYEVNYRARVWIHNMYAYVCKHIASQYSWKHEYTFDS